MMNLRLKILLGILGGVLLFGACHPFGQASEPGPTVQTATANTSPPDRATVPASPSFVDQPAEAVVPINDRHYSEALMALIDSAQESLQVCLYQVRFYDEYPGSTSNRLIDKLILAQRRGVDVKAIIDTSPWKEDGQFDAQNLQSAQRLAHGGCAVFLDPPDVQSHQKILIADGKVTVVASANWSHYSLSANREVAVMIWDAEIAAAYDAYFHERLKEATPYEAPALQGELKLQAEAVPHDGLVQPEEVAALDYDTKSPVARDARVTSINNREYYPRVSAALDNAQKSIVLIQDYAYYYATTPERAKPQPPAATPRQAPSETNLLFQDLVEAEQRGLDVKVVFDLTQYEEGGLQFSGEDFANRLWALGVDVYHDDPTIRIHAKMLLVNGHQVVIGSTNWSFQALEENNECSVLIQSNTLGAYYQRWVDSILAKAQPVVKPIEKHSDARKEAAPAPAPMPPDSQE